MENPEERTLTVQEEAFFTSVQRNSLEDAKKYLTAGVDVNVRDRNNSTALFYCTSDIQLELARHLVNAGANPNAINVRGNSPLHVAAERIASQIVLLLLLNGAETEIKNSDGKKPADISSRLKTLIPAIVDVRGVMSLLTPNHVKKLTSIFNEIDSEHTGRIDIAASARFNRFMEDVTEEAARRDADEFIRDVSVVNSGFVNLEEWLLAFAKLAGDLGVEKVDEFTTDFEDHSRSKGKFQDFH
mmetsp:Transcript_13750/g.25941  ORF Transcript_13750/g.25941 Transcript_13750/m.25941 type:complete len:243 (-) Transcript_13750:112-840(-)